MLFYSTNHKANPVTFPEALLQGQAPDRGLYMPEQIPVMEAAQIQGFSQKEYHEIAFEVISRYLVDEIEPEALKAACADAYNFQVPLEKVANRQYVMRLDQGPTASFKDFAARMMGRLMQHFLKRENRKLLILTATSGDTGSAIANAFLGLENIQVVILFPEKEVTNRQRLQMTTLGKNISVLSLDGKFDDCQALVKQAFSDPDLAHLGLSSANSINIGRLIPQTVYYFYAWSRLAEGVEKVIFSVPSGNFGDMMGGILAMKMGLPVERFLIAVNENDEFATYLSTGRYQKTEPSRNCISSAMNVGHPSNLARLVSLYGGMMDEKGILSKQADLEMMRKELWAISITDEQTKETIIEAWKNHRLLLEPHGAVGWKCLQTYLEKHPETREKNPLCISLETAHPAKFPEEINRLLGFDPDLPPSLLGIEGNEEKYGNIDKDFESFKNFLLKYY